MLTLLGVSMIICFMYLIMSKKLSALVALTLIPFIFSIIAWLLGFHFESLSYIELIKLGEMMLEGIKKVAPIGIMLLFAIMYFALMIDSGLFDPFVNWIVQCVKGDPVRIAIGTVILTMLISLDGDGSTTYMICVTAMLPLYKRIGMNPLIMTALMILANGTMNIVPWGGPTARVASALNIDPRHIFVPMLPALVIACLWLIFIAYLYGKFEKKRLGIIHEINIKENFNISISKHPDAHRPDLRKFNAALTFILMVCLIMGILPMPILFMLGFCLALAVNYPCLEKQKQRIAIHANTVLSVVGVIFAAGVFTGILTGTGMVDAMSHEFTAIIPPVMGPYMAPITALISIPLTFFMSNDAFYYGVVPILSEAASNYGITPLEIARASLIGQPVHVLSPLVPSTYLLCGLASVEFNEHQKFTIWWAILTCLIFLITALLFGIFPLLKI
ncbi:CitMHS family transporter [Acinetobacter soli]|uniref:CitMHS family transporter n=1 Tax=Acinetobacter soli TaxID=487316 RepID=UPI00287DE293|nr:CitMHS family transporter [Acinetobacter soli]MDS7693311.1 CitMHS family transporter [Acinetobacter soli]